ncbi:MAG: hypothetical protein K9N47_07420 [Prosthecobacter sp.]|uniref:lipopolysaccharide biosynthesis protein n=1 Tax=Prosthecobacter sp. TaxID=1965333 RepID=UPI0025EE62EB|nr:hypothetical protein [Prosthecobacter sp.]MCF7785935.1 hypothetical protein [Prosthecobacter sp.]
MIGTLPSEPVNTLGLRFARWREPLQSFIVGQPSVQILNLITGFFLLRWLDVEQFAMFGIAFAFQSTVTQLSDLGFSGSIIALAGDRVQDPTVLGGFLRSARHWRFKVQSGMLVLAAVAFPLITWGQDWGAMTKALIFGAIALGVLFQGWSMYGAPLLAHRALSAYYRPQIWAALLRLVFCAGLWGVGWLNAWAASLLAALALGYCGMAYRRSSATYIVEPAASEPERNAAMLRYLAPLIPGVAFTALQGQIQMGVIAVLGSTQNIAEVSALGRLSQLFVLFGAFVTVFVQPYVARLARTLLLRRYLQIVAASSVFCFGLIGLGWVCPQVFLWFLGPNYSELGVETTLTLVIGCINAMGGVLFAMHAARSWLFWWSPFVYIPVMLITQIVCILLMDLSSTLSVVWFGIISSMVSVAVQMSVGIYGFHLKTSSRHSTGSTPI